MRIEIEVELEEKVGPRYRPERRRFSRDVEMDLPAVGDQIELNVAGEPVFVVVTGIAVDEASEVHHVKVNGGGLTFRALRDDERWTDKLVW
jgi:hypothetical protein